MELDNLNFGVISSRLAEVIADSNLSQKEIAEKIGVSKSMLSHYKAGKKLPALDTFAKLCVVLDIDPKFILGIDN